MAREKQCEGQADATDKTKAPRPPFTGRAGLQFRDVALRTGLDGLRLWIRRHRTKHNLSIDSMGDAIPLPTRGDFRHAIPLRPGVPLKEASARMSRLSADIGSGRNIPSLAICRCRIFVVASSDSAWLENDATWLAIEQCNSAMDDRSFLIRWAWTWK